MRTEEYYRAGNVYVVNGKEIPREEIDENAKSLIDLLKTRSVTFIEAELSLQRAIELLDMQII